MGVYINNPTPPLSFKTIINDVTSDLNTTQTGAGTNSANKTYTISSTDLIGKSYVPITVTAKHTLTSGGSGTQKTHIKIETGDHGGALSIIYDEDVCTQALSAGGTTVNMQFAQTIVHTLTAGNITNGLDVKITSSSIVVTAGTASLTNKQITATTTA